MFHAYKGKLVELKCLNVFLYYWLKKQQLSFIITVKFGAIRHTV